MIGHLTLADGTKTEITVTSVKPDGTIVTDYGTFHLDTKTGEYTFTKAESTGNATDQLQLGDKVELDFSISVKDSHGETASSTHDVTVVINGSNDRPSATMQASPSRRRVSMTATPRPRPIRTAPSALASTGSPPVR